MTHQLEELSYEPRNYGKSFKAWQVFIASSRKGESAVYRTPEGDICSPERVKQLIAQHDTDMLEEIKQLQTYKLSADSEDKLVIKEEVIEVIEQYQHKPKEQE